MPYDFFFSYKRVSKTAYQRRFFDDLSAELRDLRELSKDVPVGFFDQSGIEPGEEWAPRLAQALQESNVLVCAYSPKYFESEYCGKEWQVFRMRSIEHQRLRRAAGKADAALPPVIKPVLWLPLPDDLDPEYNKFQFFRGTTEDVANREGVRFVLQRRNNFRKLYADYINRLALDIIEAARYDLPPLPNLPPLQDVPSAFTSSAPRVVTAPQPAAAGGSATKHVTFIFVAGDPARFGGRRQPDAYLQRGGPDWKPFHPMPSDRIARIVQHFVSEEEMDYDSDVIAFGETTDLIGVVQQAYRDRKIVVIVVDGWTLTWDADSRDKLRTFDMQNRQTPFYNCSVLVPWNEGDLELRERRDEIMGQVRDTFHSRAKLFRNPVFYRDSISSVAHLHDALRDALTNIRAELHGRADERKPVPQDFAKPAISNQPPATGQDR